MRKLWVLSAIFLCIAAGSAFSSRTRSMSIQTNRAELRSAPNYFSSVLGELAYTDMVEVMESRGGWSQVRDAQGRTGWIHESALTRKALTLKATGQDVDTGVSTDEQALAGKGFNPQVESEYKNRNKEADYAAVDAMEKQHVTPQAAIAFLKAGGITPDEGGAQ